MVFRQILELETQNLEITMQKCGMLLRRLPKGRLNVQFKNDRPYYRTIQSDGIEHSIPRDDKLVELLSSRRIAEKVMQNAAESGWFNICSRSSP